jgi:LysR family glycine cleavage system transcriptional activator
MLKLPLTALQVFEVAASKRSFAAAAAALHVTPSAVTRQIRGLEERLGYALFDRSGPVLGLTERGAELLPAIQRGFLELRRAVESARHRAASHQLSVTMLASFLQRWLLPRLPDFQKRHATIDLRVSTSSQLAKLSESDIDAGIRLGRGHWSGLRATKICDEWLVPVGRPDMVASHGLIDSPAMLGRLPLLHGDDEPWSEWTAVVFSQDVSLPAGPRMDDSIGVIIGAERGHGIALARWSLAAADVASGRLAIAARTAVTFHRSYYFVTLPSKHDLPAVTAFRSWLVERGREVLPPPVAIHKPGRRQ